MIEYFKQPWLQEFWNTGRHKKIPPDLGNRLLRKLDMLNSAKELKDLAVPPANHLHPLHGEREGQWVISVNGPWRLVFNYNEGQIYDVELAQYY